MDHALQTIAEFATTTDLKSLGGGDVTSAARHLLDSIGCAGGGFDSDVGRIVRRYADARPQSGGSSVFGIPHSVSVEAAAFANGCHVRYLDLNDAYFGPCGGHPSDLIAALLAAGEHRSLPGHSLVTAIYVAYEVFGALAEAAPLQELGWDMGAQTSIAAAAGFANLFGLDGNAAENAVSLAITPSLPLRVTRTGELSQWKGCAAPYAAATALTAAQLAELGLTGPKEPFVGAQGLFSHVGEFTLDVGRTVGGLSALERTSFKAFPAVYHAQGPIQMALDLRSRLDVNAIEQITVSTYEGAWLHTGGGLGDRAEKWDPQTRETADHSIPYLVAIALVDGSVTIDSFRLERVRDPSLRPLMDKIAVTVDDTLAWGDGGDVRPATRMEVRMVDGSTTATQVEFPTGHPRNPMSDVALGGKCTELMSRVLRPQDAQALLDVLWDIVKLESLSDLRDAIRSFGHT